jgi:hypothetical protein
MSEPRAPRLYALKRSAIRWLNAPIGPTPKDDAAVGHETTVRNRDQGWLEPLPISEPRQYRGVEVSTTLRAFLPISDISKSLETELEAEIKRVLDGHGPKLTCYLGSGWQFDKIEAHAQVRAGHQYEGLNAESPARRIVLALHDIEMGLRLVHSSLPASAISAFWTSWHVAQHIASFSGSLAEARQNRHRGNRDLIMATWFAARQLMAYAHEVHDSASIKNSESAAPPVGFAVNLDRLRRGKGWSWDTLADHAGFNKKTLLGWAQGKPIRAQNKATLAKVFGVTIAELDA